MGRRLDLLAAAAAALAVAMTAVYLVLLRQEQDRPVPWVLVVLALGAAGSGYGAVARLGMVRHATCEHPRLAEGHDLRPHLVYRIGREDRR